MSEPLVSSEKIDEIKQKRGTTAKTVYEDEVFKRINSLEREISALKREKKQQDDEIRGYELLTDKLLEKLKGSI